MRFACCCSIMLVLSVAFLGISRGAPEPPVVAITGPRTPAEEQKCFHLPPGFDIELVAAEPAIIKPIQMNFDDRNRLWVTQSVEYPFAAPRNLIRLSVGIESVDDLIADLEAALVRSTTAAGA